MPALRRKINIVAQLTSSARWVFGVFWEISPKLTIGIFIATFFVEIFSVANAFIFAKAIDTLLKVASGDLDKTFLYLILALFFGLSIVDDLLHQFIEYARRALRISFHPKYEQKVYEKLISLGIPSLEDPEITNLIVRVKRYSGKISNVFFELNNLLSSLTAATTSAVILFVFAPQLIFIYMIVLIPKVFIDRKHLKRIWIYERELTEDSRRAYESSTYLSRPVYLLELLITGGHRKLSKHFEGFIDSWLEKLLKLRKIWYTKSYFANIFRYVVDIYANLLIFTKFIKGVISIGDVTFYIRQISTFTNSVSRLNNRVSNIYESTLHINEARELFNMPKIKDGKEIIGKMKSGPRILIDNVSFKYPNSEKYVLRKLNLDIRTGEKIAIVGANGAGKTTLVKLIMRFYNPNSGNIFINSHKLSDIKISSFYENVSTLFQEYNTYGNFTAKENIEIGDLTVKPSEDKLSTAAERANALEFIDEYPNKFNQGLSERYMGGIRPSTGQWQKVAIARFFYRDASLVIFDEPTAAIDAESEKKIFDNIYKFFKKKTVIIISHRFSTVRNADRILVIKHGKIVEEGSHEKLMKLNGRYAKLFKLQAKGYK